MSWVSDVRCLYCDGKLPLYRKITNGQFCSTPHRKLYWQEQERLAVERLHQTHDSLRAIRPPEGVQAILGTVVEEIPAPSGIIQPVVTAKFDESLSRTAGDAYAYDSEIHPRTPFWAPQIATPSEVEPPAPLAEFIRVYALPQAQWPADRLEAAEPNALEAGCLVRLPLSPPPSKTRDVVAARIVKIPIEPQRYQSAPRLEAVNSLLQPYRDLSLTATPQGGVLAAAPEQDYVPRAETPMALAKFAPVDCQRIRRDPWPAASFAVLRAHLPLGMTECGVTPARAMLTLGGLRPLSLDLVPLVHGTWIDSLRAMGKDTSEESPRYELSTPALRPRLRLAAGSRYTVATRDRAMTVAAIEPENLPAPAKEVAIPERKAMAAAAGATSAGASAEQIQAPGAAGLLPLASATPNEPKAPNPVPSFSPPQPLSTEPMRPASRLEPIDAKPIADFIAAPPAPPLTPEEPKEKLNASVLGDLMPPEGKEATPAWSHIAGFWKHAPRDLKLLMFGIPILLALALHPSLRKITYTAPPQAAEIPRGIEHTIEHNFESQLSQRWLNIKQSMKDRAAIALDEDFRSGLDDWTSRGGTTDWAFDATGFVRPGPLALYVPSLELTDYQLQFLGMVDKKAMSWVVRAADFDDYYVVKLVVLKPGPVPTMGITRYAVIHGVAQNRADTVAFINAREDMLYRVLMDIHGDSFALTIQGQMVDSWSEPRLRKGGVGFFSARGESSRLRWVQLTHQYDTLGRLCAYLAPYNIPSTNGGWQP